MTQQNDPNSGLRAAFAMHLLDHAKSIVQPESGPIGVFVRVALAVIFMYLIVISYLMLGTTGLVFVSVLCLVAYFVPHLYQASLGLLARRRARTEKHTLTQQSPQEG